MFVKIFYPLNLQYALLKCTMQQKWNDHHKLHITDEPSMATSLSKLITQFVSLQSRGAEIDQSMTRSVLQSMKATMFKTDYFVLTVTLSLAKLQNEGKLSGEEVQSFIKDNTVRNFFIGRIFYRNFFFFNFFKISVVPLLLIRCIAFAPRHVVAGLTLGQRGSRPGSLRQGNPLWQWDNKL